ncbi:hypothetical protein B7494_g7204, partial [Chlorociboria aeruginascens]
PVIRHIQPAAVRRGNTLARVRDDPETYYAAELRTERLDEIQAYLWLAGLPRGARALHRQQLLGREILITEDPNEHLVWHETRIFVKPLPTFLFSLDCWTQEICKTKQLYEAACGFLLSYAWLVRHESDLRVAHEKALLPDGIDWVAWTALMDDFLPHIDLRSLRGISSRFQYGELRLSRLNKIYRLTRFRGRDFVRGYMTASTWYQDFFARNFAWLLAVFAVVSVALSAMQVVVTAARGGQAFEDASYGFAVASLFMAAGTALVVLLLWGTLFGARRSRGWTQNTIRRIAEGRNADLRDLYVHHSWDSGCRSYHDVFVDESGYDKLSHAISLQLRFNNESSIFVVPGSAIIDWIEDELRADMIPEWKRNPDVLQRLVKLLYSKQLKAEYSPQFNIADKDAHILTIIILEQYKIIIWCALPATQLLAYAIFQALDIDSGLYTADATTLDRADIVNAYNFTPGKCMAFIGSGYCGSDGINLQHGGYHMVELDLAPSDSLQNRIVHATLNKALPGVTAGLSVNVTVVKSKSISSNDDVEVQLENQCLKPHFFRPLWLPKVNFQGSLQGHALGAPYMRSGDILQPYSPFAFVQPTPCTTIIMEGRLDYRIDEELWGEELDFGNKEHLTPPALTGYSILDKEVEKLTDQEREWYFPGSPSQPSASQPDIASPVPEEAPLPPSPIPPKRQERKTPEMEEVSRYVVPKVQHPPTQTRDRPPSEDWYQNQDRNQNPPTQNRSGPPPADRYRSSFPTRNLSPLPADTRFGPPPPPAPGRYAPPPADDRFLPPSQGRFPQQDYRPPQQPFNIPTRLLTDLMEVYNNDDKKYGGEEYDILERKLQIFYDYCFKIGLQPDQYQIAFSTMLKGRAEEFYFAHIAGRFYDFPTIVKMTKAHFETEETKQKYLTEWRRTTLSRAIAENPGKNRLECLEIVIDKLQQVQPGLAEGYQGDSVLRDQVLNSCQGIPECQFALFQPSPTFQGLCAGLRSAISMTMQQHMPAYTTDSSANSYTNLYTDPKKDGDPSQFWVDRVYGEGTHKGKEEPAYGGNTRGGRTHQDHSHRGGMRGGRFDKGRQSDQRCYVCHKCGCYLRVLEVLFVLNKWNRFDHRFLLTCEYIPNQKFQPDHAQFTAITLEEAPHTTFLTELGSIDGRKLVSIRNDQAAYHALTKDDKFQQTKVQDSSTFTFDRYSSDKFQGIMPDSRAAGISSAGEPQSLALQKENPNIKLDVSSSGANRSKFGKGTAIAKGTVQVPTPLGEITFHVVPTNTPFLMCLQDMDALGARFDNLRNLLVQGDKIIPVTRTWGHPWMLLNNREEMLAWSHRFGPLSVQRFIQVLERSGHDTNFEAIKKLTELCHQRQMHGKSPGKFKFTLKDDVDFNHSTAVEAYRQYLESVLLYGSNTPFLQIGSNLSGNTIPTFQNQRLQDRPLINDSLRYPFRPAILKRKVLNLEEITTTNQIAIIIVVKPSLLEPKIYPARSMAPTTQAGPGLRIIAIAVNQAIPTLILSRITKTTNDDGKENKVIATRLVHAMMLIPFEYLAETYGEASVLAVLPIAIAGDALNWFDSLDHVIRRAINVSLDEWKDQLRARFQANALEEADSLRHPFADDTNLPKALYQQSNATTILTRYHKQCLSSKSQSFLAITAYWIANNWEWKEVLIGFEHITGSHSGASMAKIVKNALDFHKLTQRLHCITTDGASNNGTIVGSTSLWLMNKTRITWSMIEFMAILLLVFISIYWLSQPQTSDLEFESDHVHEPDPLASQCELQTLPCLPEPW